MKTFDYYVADNLDAALREYGKENPPVLKAGGMDLHDRIKEGITLPEAVLSIHRVPDLAYIKEENGGIAIGCLTTLADMGRNATLKEKFAGLHTAAAHAATPQVRERATLGGNLCQRPRCWYYRNEEFHCLKKEGPTCFAVDGENEYHAIFGDGPCHIVHPSNTAPALVAMNAQFIVRKGAASRTIPAAEFFVMPDEKLSDENVLEPGEVIEEIAIPKTPEASATIELREKQSFDWPLCIASVAKVDGQWRVVLGAVAPKPWLSEAAGKILGGQEITEELAKQAGEAAAQGAKPMSRNAYKVQLVKVAVKRALMKAAGMEVPA
jgi:xanthine dehydrogenase YagS FAD-binding subunit